MTLPELAAFTGGAMWPLVPGARVDEAATGKCKRLAFPQSHEAATSHAAAVLEYSST